MTLAAFDPAVTPGSLSAQTAAPDLDETIPQEWLVKKISVEDAEVANPGIEDDRKERSPAFAKPFGFHNKQWEALKAERQAGDEIWTFRSPADHLLHLAGRAGVALVRRGKIVRVIVTVWN